MKNDGKHWTHGQPNITSSHQNTPTKPITAWLCSLRRLERRYVSRVFGNRQVLSPPCLFEYVQTFFHLLSFYIDPAGENWWACVVAVCKGWSYSMTVWNSDCAELLFSEGPQNEKDELKERSLRTYSNCRFGLYINNFFFPERDKKTWCMYTTMSAEYLSRQGYLPNHTRVMNITNIEKLQPSNYSFTKRVTWAE